MTTFSFGFIRDGYGFCCDLKTRFFGTESGTITTLICVRLITARRYASTLLEYTMKVQPSVASSWV